MGLIAAHYANSLRTVPGAGSIPVFALGVISLYVPVKKKKNLSVSVLTKVYKQVFETKHTNRIIYVPNTIL